MSFLAFISIYTYIVYMEIKNFYLTTPQIAALEKLAKEKDLSVSELIRRAIDEYLDKQKQRKKKNE